MTTLPAIRHSFTVAAPVDKVWEAIATSEGLAAWLMPNTFQPVIGGRFTFQSEPMGNWDGIVPCQLLDIKKPHRLHLHWYINQHETTLQFELREVKGGTEVTITHSGWENVPIEFLGLRRIMDQGWGEYAPEQLREYLAKTEQGN